MKAAVFQLDPQSLSVTIGREEREGCLGGDEAILRTPE